ncbi:MAG: hypothetical protein AAGH99_09140 [Planctomycetota bacterium]
MQHSAIRRLLFVASFTFCFVLNSVHAHADQHKPAEQAAAPIMTVDEVRVGMKGYGKTVFQGNRVEPFGFEVVSVISDSSAKRATVWVICTDERMTRSGPVQGMSGSPMYIWDEGEEKVIGEGGRLIGAFAFGYADVNVCLVGVQPIEYMREVGERADAEDVEAPQARQVGPETLAQSMAALQTAATQTRTARQSLAGLTGVQQLLEKSRLVPPVTPSVNPTFAVRTPAGFGKQAEVQPMLLPMAVGSSQAAELLGPLLAPSGIALVSDPLTAVAGKPPSNVDLDNARLEPGSVLSIPLAYGDLDLSAAGTVTEVQPDGTVLGFGHAMSSVGSSRLPMATGYTHFVVSRDSISFKRAGSLDIVGSIVRDEASAVAGVGDLGFFAAPVSVRVALPDQPVRDYKYHVVDDVQMTPGILAAVTAQSLTAVQAPPVYHTMRTTGTMTFTGGRTFELDSLIAGEGLNGLIFDMLPPVVSMMQNPFDPLRLESVDIDITVEKGIELDQMLSASLDKRSVRPGETVNINVVLQPFDGPAYTKTLPFDLPGDLDAGEYQLLISDANRFTNRMVAGRPDLARIENADELLSALQTLADIDRKMIYVGMPQRTPGLAVGGQPLSDLPSSRSMVLGATSSSSITPYPRFVEQAYPAERLIAGDLSLKLQVLPANP